MGLESATYINQLNAANPVGAVDPKGQGDDHIRMVKATLQASFPNITGAMTATHTRLNALDATGLTGFAIPTSDVDLAAETAGVATTAMRSDAKLQLSQGISPTWTAVHTFSSSVNFNGSAIFTRASGTINTTWTDGTVTTRYYSSGGSTLANFGTGSNHPLVLLTNDLPRFTIAANGALSAAGVATWTGTHTFSAAGTAPLRVDAASNHSFSLNSTDTTNGGYQSFNVNGTPVGYIGTGPNLISGQVVTDWGILAVARLLFGYNGGTLGFTLDTNGGVFMRNATGGSQGQGTINAVGVYINGQNVKSLPLSTTTTTLALSDVGKCVDITAAINIPASVFAAGDIVSIYNNSAGALNITISAGTLRLAGTATTGTRSLPQRKTATLWFRVGGATPEVICEGAN